MLDNSLSLYVKQRQIFIGNKILVNYPCSLQNERVVPRA